MPARILAIPLLLFAGLLGCATAEDSTPPPTDTLIADSVDAFSAQPSPPNRPAQKPTVEFFFKRCDSTGNASHYSRTSYDCAYP